MRQIKKCHRFVWQLRASWLPLVVGMAISFWLSGTDRAEWTVAAAVATGVYGAALVSVWAFRLQHFRCPDCGRVLGNGKAREQDLGSPINFVCAHCDVEWETGITQGPGGAG